LPSNESPKSSLYEHNNKKPVKIQCSIKENAMAKKSFRDVKSVLGGGRIIKLKKPIKNPQKTISSQIHNGTNVIKNEKLTR
jgi:hypothetical protein